jgi:hypothetical protein
LYLGHRAANPCYLENRFDPESEIAAADSGIHYDHGFLAEKLVRYTRE